MRTRTTIAWVILSIVAIGGYWYTGTLEEEKQREAFESKRLFDFEGKDVVRLSITTRESGEIEARRTSDTKWELHDPYSHVHPNHALWTDLAEKVVPFIMNQRNIDVSSEDLELYALDDPPLSILIETNSKQLIQLDIGRADPTGNNHYAKLSAGGVFLLPAQFAKVLYRSLDELRDKRVFPMIDYTVDRIHYTRFPVDVAGDGIEPEPGIDEEYELGADNQWRVTQPIEILAFQDEMDHLINQIQYAGGDDFVDSPSDLSDYGLDPPWAKLSVMNSEKNIKQTIWLGWIDEMADGARWFATVEGNPSVFTIDNEFVNHLPQQPLDFREDHIFTGRATNIASIVYKDSKGQFTLTNDDDIGWMLTDPAYPDTDNIRVSYLITGLRRIFGTRFPDEEEVDQYFGGERTRYTFHFKDGSPSTFVSIGGPVPDTTDPVMFYVRQDFGPVTTIPMQFRTFLNSNTFRFRKPELLPFDTKTAMAVSIRIEETTYSLTNQNGIWTVTEPANHVIENTADISTILNALRAVYAANVIDSPPGVDISGLDSPVLEASVTYLMPDGTPKVLGPLRLGNLISEQARAHFATLEGRPETFKVDHSLIESLRVGLQGIRPVQP